VSLKRDNFSTFCLNVNQSLTPPSPCLLPDSEPGSVLSVESVAPPGSRPTPLSGSAPRLPSSPMSIRMRRNVVAILSNSPNRNFPTARFYLRYP
jgi:hypothetical protein